MIEKVYLGEICILKEIYYNKLKKNDKLTDPSEPLLKNKDDIEINNDLLSEISDFDDFDIEDKSETKNDGIIVLPFDVSEFLKTEITSTI